MTAKPKFLYDNRLKDAVPVASSTAAGFNVLNLLDFRPFTWWQPSSLPATVTIDSGVPRAADYALIYGHSLHDARVAVEIRGSNDNFVTEDVLLATSNLLTVTEQFDSSLWVKLGSSTVTPNVIQAPDGTHTADRLNGGNAADSGVAYGLSVYPSTPYTFSMYVRPSTNDYAHLEFDTANVRVRFRLSTQEMVVELGSPAGYALEVLPNGIYRCSVSIMTGGAQTTEDVILYQTNDGSVGSTVTSSQYLYLWGAALKFGLLPGYYEGIANGPLYLPFATASYRYRRLRFVQLAGSTIPQIAIAAIGAALDADQYLSAPFDPRGRETVATLNRSSQGHPLGRVIDFESWERTLEFEDISWDWVRNSFEPAWAAHLRGQPFAFAWDPEGHGNEIVLVNASGGYDVPHRAGGFCTLRLPVQGTIE